MDWEGENALSVIDARRTLEDPESPRDEFHHLASDLFVGDPMVETEWEPSLALVGVAGTGPLVRTLIGLVGQMTPDRRRCLVGFAEDQVVLSRLETHRAAAEFLDISLQGSPATA